MGASGGEPFLFGAILGVNLGMGLITPPTAPILYFAGAVGKASLPLMLGPTLHFIFLCSLPVLMLTTFVPALALALQILVLGYAGLNGKVVSRSRSNIWLGCRGSTQTKKD